MLAGAARLCIVLNPVSGPTRTRGAEWGWLVPAAEEAGWQPTMVASSGPGDIERLVSQAIETGVRRVVVVGGDGSINEAMQPLVSSGIELGIIPAGTSNILANELSLPEDFRAAATIAFAGRGLDIDVGIANGRHFALMIGVGYDAVLTATMWPQLKRLAGQVAYTIAGVQAFVRHRGARMHLTVDGTKHLRRLVYMLVVANTRLYGRANASVAEHADVRDGQFDLCIYRSRAWYHVIFALSKVLLHLPIPYTRLETLRCQSLTIRSAREVPYQLDGDPVGVLPVRVEIKPLALRVVVSEATASRSITP